MKISQIYNCVLCLCLQGLYRAHGGWCCPPSCCALFPWWCASWAWGAPPVWRINQNRRTKWLSPEGSSLLLLVRIQTHQTCTRQARTRTAQASFSRVGMFFALKTSFTPGLQHIFNMIWLEVNLLVPGNVATRQMTLRGFSLRGFRSACSGGNILVRPQNSSGILRPVHSD